MHRRIGRPSERAARGIRTEERGKGTQPKPEKVRAREPDDETRARAKDSNELA